MPSTPVTTKQDIRDLAVLRRIHLQNPQLNLEQLLHTLRATIGHEPSPLATQAARSLIDPYQQGRDIIMWKKTGK
ncbi:hypothetical protein RRF57_004141 [Xylaria bambusicola]|uniref:Uncharacterized protein n=1 Tax=Xylaria bambusicola TaxID=326684 RepID=A0AAN7ULF7_9PEZI